MVERESGSSDNRRGGCSGSIGGDDVKDDEIMAACVLVERVARSIGKDCEIIFTDEGVQVALLSWGGCSTGETLYEALKDARS